MSFKGKKGDSLQSHAVKQGDKGMPGVTADKTGSPKSHQMAKDLHVKYNTKRRHA